MVERRRAKKRNRGFILKESERSHEPKTSEGVFLTHKPVGCLCAATRLLELSPLWLCGVWLQEGWVAPLCVCGGQLFEIPWDLCFPAVLLS